MYIIAYKILSRILLLLLLLRKSWSKDILSSASSFPLFMSASVWGFSAHAVCLWNVNIQM